DGVRRRPVARAAASAFAVLRLADADRRPRRAGVARVSDRGKSARVFPAALLMGVAFPIGLRVWAGRGADETGTIARRIGQFYTLNVSGAIAGSLAGGFVLLPWFGSRASLAILATTIFGSGLLLLAVSELRRRSRLV